MVTTKIGRHTVRIYDSIEELPIVRFHKYQKLLLIDAGVGADLAAFDARLEKARRFILDGKPDAAMQELNNLRQAVYFIQQDINPRHAAFAVLVAELDGKPCDDLSDEALARVTEALSDAPVKDLAGRAVEVKKKIDDELALYFPALFNDAEVKEYYSILRKRTLAVLDAIVRGEANPDGSAEIDKLTTALLTFSHPKTFAGAESAEIQYDRNFENLCLTIGEQLHCNAKQYSVLEFYNAFNYLQEKARAVKKASKTR